MNNPPIDFEQVEALGISREAYDEVLDIIGRIPTIDELSTLLAMWESNGRQQSLYGWLKGQRHAVERNDYVYTGEADHQAYREPRIKDCITIARELCQHGIDSGRGWHLPTSPTPLPTGMLLYMIGNVSSEFAGSTYAQQCLHLVDNPMATSGHADDCAYIEMIVSALTDASLVRQTEAVATGGLFRSLLAMVAPRGFDILIPREVRLDAFLFGEEPGRYISAIDESNEDVFLLKLGEAKLNCCFLGRTTKGRLMADGFDFGPVARYVTATKQ